MTKKAERYVYGKTKSITHLPGDNVFSLLVASQTNPSTPHIVKYQTNGKFECDHACKRYTAYKICSHTVAAAEYRKELHSYISYFKKTKKRKLNDLLDTTKNPKAGQKKTKSTQKGKGAPRNKADKDVPLMFTSSQSSSSPNIENSNNTSLPLSVNIPFQRPPYPDPKPTTFITAILQYCPPNTSTCFGCRKNIREPCANISNILQGLCFITKSRRPVGRDENGMLTYIDELRNVYFHFDETCVRFHFPNFVCWFSPVYSEHRCFLNPEQT